MGADKETLVKMADGLWGQTVSISAYLMILLYYREAVCTGFVGEYNCAPTFHCIVQQALHSSMLMDLSKLYDVSSKGGDNTVSVQKLMQRCRQNINLFPVEKPGSHISGWCYPIRQRDYEIIRCKFSGKLLLPADMVSAWPWLMVVTPAEMFSLFGVVLRRYRNAIVNLMERRNRVYAHNDGEVCFDVDVLFKENDILWSDITGLLDLAYDVCSFVLGALTNVSKPRNYDNIDDVRNMFRMLRVGRKYLMSKRLGLIERPGVSEAIKVEVRKAAEELKLLDNEWLDEIKVPKFLESSYTDALIHSRLEVDESEEKR